MRVLVRFKVVLALAVFNSYAYEEDKIDSFEGTTSIDHTVHPPGDGRNNIHVHVCRELSYGLISACSFRGIGQQCRFYI